MKYIFKWLFVENQFKYPKMQLLNVRNIKIIIIDECTLFQRVMKELLVNELSCEIIGEVSTEEDFFTLKNIHIADLILMNIHMPQFNGIEIAKRMTYKYPNAKIIAITVYSEKVYLDQIVEAGFRGCLLKSNFFAHLIPAFECVLNGRLYFDKEFHVK